VVRSRKPAAAGTQVCKSRRNWTVACTQGRAARPILQHSPSVSVTAPLKHQQLCRESEAALRSAQ
jgi:hypothetical protein